MIDKICTFLTNRIRKEMPEIDDERADSEPTESESKREKKKHKKWGKKKEQEPEEDDDITFIDL